LLIAKDYIELYYNFVKEEILTFKNIQLRYIDTKKNLSDICTKGIIGPTLLKQLNQQIFSAT
jgi:hypothetical protein